MRTLELPSCAMHVLPAPAETRSAKHLSAYLLPAGWQLPAAPCVCMTNTWSRGHCAAACYHRWCQQSMGPFVLQFQS